MAWTWLDLLLFSASVYRLAWLVTCSNLVDHASAQGSLSSGRRARGHLARAQAHEPDARGEDNPIHAVQRWAGHTDLKTTQIYLHASDDDLVAVAESVL